MAVNGTSVGSRLWTVPNVVTGVRLVGVPFLVWSGYQGHRSAVVWILVLLLGTDWIDGKLAVLLDQVSELGARLDSAADALMYAGLGLCFWWLEGDAVRQHLPWFVAAIGTWGVSGAVGLLRFGRLPSYHAWSAKASWLVVGTTSLYWLVTGSAAPVPWALGLVAFTNLEEAAIGLLLPAWRADVRSILQALALREEGLPVGDGPDP